MASYWILKTEPSTYSYEQLERDKSTVWDGVRNNLALKHIRSMRRGDQALIYHSGSVKAAGRLARPVVLAEIKADHAFQDLALVRMPRLSVVPVKAAQWRRLLQMAK